MIKELRKVEGIPDIENEVMNFNGMPFCLKQYDGHIINVALRDGFARPCTEDVAVDSQKCQYGKKNGYVTANFSHDGTEFKMLICEADNRVFIYRLTDFEIGDALVAIGVKTMEAPIERINLLRPFLVGDDIECAYKTIIAMTGMTEDDACRLLYREFIKCHNQTGLTLKIFRTAEFIDSVGAECWLRRNHNGHNVESKNVEFIKLPEDGITSSTTFDGLRMSCVGTYGDYLLLSAWTGSGAVWLMGNAAFFKIDPDNFVFTGEPTVNFPVNSNVTLRNAALRSSLCLGENPTITIDGDSSITVEHFDSCINCLGEVTISGRGSLALTCKTHSSAIGCGGYSQSYGRYVPSREANSISKVIVDGVQLEVTTGTPNFSIGTYGLNNDVEIVLRNGGTVNGVPEATGKVKLISVGGTSAGSTKIEGPAIYCIEPHSDNRANYEIQAEPYAVPDKKFVG